MATFKANTIPNGAWAQVLMGASSESVEDSFVSVDTTNSKIIANVDGWYRVDVDILFAMGAPGGSILMDMWRASDSSTNVIASHYKTSFDLGALYDDRLSCVQYFYSGSWVEVNMYGVGATISTVDIVNAKSTISMEKLLDEVV